MGMGQGEQGHAWIVPRRRCQARRQRGRLAAVRGTSGSRESNRDEVTVGVLGWLGRMVRGDDEMDAIRTSRREAMRAIGVLAAAGGGVGGCAAPEPLVP